MEESYMANVFCRTILLYLLIVLLMRLTGKREVGQLELTELVTAFMISELASIPITNNNIPLLYGVIPTVTLVSLEVFLSYLCIKSKLMKKLFSGLPAVLINKGKVNQKEMNSSRISLPELMSTLRVLGYSALSEVNYAILEPSGNLSVIPMAGDRPPTGNEMSLSIPDKGMEHILISDGVLFQKELDACSVNHSWLESQLAKNNCPDIKNVFYFGVNDAKDVNIILKEKSK